MDKILYRLKSTQTGVDIATVTSIPTTLKADSKLGWLISRMSCYWVNAHMSVAADVSVTPVLATTQILPSIESPDEIARIGWAVSNSGGVAVTYGIEPQKDRTLFVPRLTVQPTLFLHNVSSASGVAVQMYVEIEYSLEKLSDLEVLRLLQSGG